MKRLVLMLMLAGIFAPLQAAVRFAAGGLSFGLAMGYSPDVFYLSERSEALADQNLKIRNQMTKINSTYSSAAYGQKQVIRDYQSTGNSMGGIPVEASLKYSWFGVLLRIGFVYYNIPVESRSYVLTTGAATTRVTPSSSGSSSLYEDINNLHDSDYSNDESLAVGLRSTYGQSVRFIQHVRLTRFEIPVTFGVSMFDLGPASFFFGGGMTYYYASKTRVVHAEAETGTLQNAGYFVDDIDQFKAESIGFHIMMGGEYRFFKDVGITMDITLDFGSTGPITDSIRTGAFTNDSLFHLNNGQDYGGNEKPEDIATEKGLAGAESLQVGRGLERTDSFDFQGLRLMVGVNYHIARNKESGGKEQ